MPALLRHPSAASRYQSHRCVLDAVATSERAQKGDPTGTSSLRRRYRSSLITRWSRLRLLVRKVVVGQDLLGLSASSRTGSLSLAVSGLSGDGRIVAFQTWLDDALKTAVLETDAAYLDNMIALAYRQGVARAVRLTQNPARPPGQADTIASLQQLVVVEMQGILEAVSQALVRVAANALIDGTLSPMDVFLRMAAGIKKVGQMRGETLVEAMTIKAHATGTLDQFEAAGVRAVGIVPETVIKARDFTDARSRVRPGPGARSRYREPGRRTVQRIRKAQRRVEQLKTVNIETAGDDKVCVVCEALEEDGPYTINRARSLIPAHPRCRCAFSPITPRLVEEEGDDE